MNILFREAVPTANIIAIPCITSNKQVHILADIFSVVEKEKIAQQLSQMNFHGEKAQTVLFPHNDATYLFLGFGDTETLIFKDFANLGATIYKVLSGTKAQEVAVLLNERTLSEGFTQHVIAAEMGFGAVSRSYRFDEYRTKLKEQDQPTLQKMTFVLPAAKEAAAAFVRGHSIAKGMFLARDLMCSPPNDLYPASMADKLKGLEKLGVEVEILTVKEM